MRLITMALAVLTAATLAETVNADDTPKRSAELQVLERFVGTWDFVTTNKPKGGEITTEKTGETRKWSIGGKFVHFQNPQKENSDWPEFHMLLTYDPATKTYPGILMAGPIRSVVNGTWDKETKTMTFTGTFGDGGSKLVFKNRFIDKDHCESTGVLKNAKGEVFMKQTFKQSRRKK